MLNNNFHGNRPNLVSFSVGDRVILSLKLIDFCGRKIFFDIHRAGREVQTMEGVRRANSLLIRRGHKRKNS